MNKPLIGIFTNKDNSSKESTPPAQKLGTAYSEAVIKSGGVPVLLPYTSDFASIRALMDICDGFLIPGGADVDPEFYGEAARAELGDTDSLLDEIEMMALFYLEGKGKPVMGICRGMQLMNVYAGGTLYQDLGLQYPEALAHRQAVPREKLSHQVNITADSKLSKLLGDIATVNSLHHQAVKTLGHGYIKTAESQDGIIEAMENDSGLRFAVQWHPEELLNTVPEMKHLFTHLIELSSKKA